MAVLRYRFRVGVQLMTERLNLDLTEGGVAHGESDGVQLKLTLALMRAAAVTRTKTSATVDLGTYIPRVSCECKSTQLTYFNLLSPGNRPLALALALVVPPSDTPSHPHGPPEQPFFFSSTLPLNLDIGTSRARVLLPTTKT